MAEAHKAGQPGDNPPSIPKFPPMKIIRGEKIPDPYTAGGTLGRINTHEGWQLISFPVSRLTAVSGIDRLMFCTTPTGYGPKDPLNYPDKIDTGLAYIAYFDKPGTIVYSGIDDASITSTKLHDGWNFISCPSSKAIDISKVTLTCGGATAVPQETARNSAASENAWIYLDMYTYGSKGWETYKIGQSPQYIKPGQVISLFCWKPLELNWNLNANAEIPVIGIANPASPGQTAVIKGRNFGSNPSVTLGGTPIPSSSITYKDANTIKFTVPEHISTGTARVFNGTYASNPLVLKVVPPGTATAQAQTGANPPQAQKPEAKPATAAKPAGAAQNTPAPSKASAVSSASSAKDLAIDDDIPDGLDLPSSKSQAKEDKKAEKASKSPLPASASFDLDESVGASASAQRPAFNPPWSGKDTSASLNKGGANLANSGVSSFVNLKPGTGALKGQVFNAGHPIKGASVSLNGQRTHTDSNGVFSFSNIPAGPASIRITADGFREASGNVTIAEGESRNVKVSLSSTGNSSSSSRQSAQETGSFTIKAHSYIDGKWPTPPPQYLRRLPRGMRTPRDHRYWVYKIEVWEEGNTSKHWQNTWWDDNGEAIFELNCRDANLNKPHTVKITWRDIRRNEKNGSWSRTFTSNYQTFTFDNP
ncbi:MAG: carboxypeptidase regulatory-like domain-containing protein [bacterium]|nr:carboxypeptidase regulatory-like domain-containing protein [bacterium]